MEKDYYKLPDGRYISYYELATNPNYSKRSEDVWYRVPADYVRGSIDKANWKHNGVKLNAQQFNDRFGKSQYLLVQDKNIDPSKYSKVVEYIWTTPQGKQFSADVSKRLNAEYKNKLNGVQPTVPAFYQSQIGSEDNPIELGGIEVVHKLTDEQKKKIAQAHQLTDEQKNQIEEEQRQRLEEEAAMEETRYQDWLNSTDKGWVNINQPISTTWGSGTGLDLYQGSAYNKGYQDELHSDPTGLNSMFGNRRTQVVNDNYYKPIYQYAWSDLAGNAMEGLNLASAGFINRFSPTQNIGLAIDAFQGDNIMKSWFGNSGIVSDNFAKEHPYWSMAINLAGDGAIYNAKSIANAGRQLNHQYNMYRLSNRIKNMPFTPEYKTYIESPTLKDIGTFDEYLQYQNSIFPNSAIRQTVYELPFSSYKKFGGVQFWSEPFGKAGPAKVNVGNDVYNAPSLNIPGVKHIKFNPDWPTKAWVKKLNLDADDAISTGFITKYPGRGNFQKATVFSADDYVRLGSWQDARNFKYFKQTGNAQYPSSYFPRVSPGPVSLNITPLSVAKAAAPYVAAAGVGTAASQVAPGIIQQFNNYYRSHQANAPKIYINLDGKNVQNFTDPTQQVNAVLANEFVEKNANTVLPVSQYKKLIGTNYRLGDRRIPLENISIFYGVQDGKLIAGGLDAFKDTTKVVPVRNKYFGKAVSIAKGDDGIVYAINENGEKIGDGYIDAGLTKWLLSNEQGQGIFISNLLDPDNLEKLNADLKNSPRYLIQVDNGRYSHANIQDGGGSLKPEDYIYMNDDINNMYLIGH